MNLQNQVALVTGASRGIGKAIALELARQGAKVVGTATSEAGAQAISDYLNDTCTYGYGSTSATTAFQALGSGRAVCRDFAHMGVAFCRALNIPARYVCGYLPDIDITPDPVPMDFHAWFEAFIDGQWRTFDARHNRPRAGRLIIAQGRDASDVAFTTSFGSARLTHMKVWADETTPDMTLDTPPNPRIF